jgi:hypothetical protein
VISKAEVVSIDMARDIWRPVKLACFWCGHVVVSIVPDNIRFPCECADCGLFAATITHEAPDGWSKMTEEELAEYEWVPA